MPGQKTIRGDEHVASSAEPHTAGAGEPRRVAEPTLMYVIKQVELASRARLDELFRPIGLTALQYTALTVLARHPGMSSSQLARNSFVTTQSMADMVAALEARMPGVPGAVVLDLQMQRRECLGETVKDAGLPAHGAKFERKTGTISSATGGRQTCAGGIANRTDGRPYSAHDNTTRHPSSGLRARPGRAGPAL